MSDRCPIAAEHGSDLGQRHAATDVSEIHGDLPRLGDVFGAARTVPKSFRTDAEDVRNRDIDREARAAVAMFGLPEIKIGRGLILLRKRRRRRTAQDQAYAWSEYCATDAAILGGGPGDVPGQN